MKFTITVKKEVEVKTLSVTANVRHWEDATVNGEDDVDGNIPCRFGNSWCPIIDLETGVIQNWEKGVIADVHYKVCDEGMYCLADNDGLIVKTIEGYVPTIMCPECGGYGDYIIMKIDENGKIDKWKVDLQAFENDEED